MKSPIRKNLSYQIILQSLKTEMIILFWKCKKIPQKKKNTTQKCCRIPRISFLTRSLYFQVCIFKKNTTQTWWHKLECNKFPHPTSHHYLNSLQLWARIPLFRCRPHQSEEQTWSAQVKIIPVRRTGAEQSSQKNTPHQSKEQRTICCMKGQSNHQKTST